MTRQTIHQRCRGRSAKAVIDIHHGDTACARIEHGQQGGQALKAGAIADAGWHGDHRPLDESANDAWQGAFHAGHHNQHAGRPEPVEAVEQAVQARNSDIVQTLHLVAQQFGRYRRLFSNREVGRPGRNDKQAALLGRRAGRLSEAGQSGLGVVAQRR